MDFKNLIDEREFLGREALKDMMEKDLYPKSIIKFTNYNCPFDALILPGGESPQSGVFNQKLILAEIKIRDRIFDEYFLEYKKCKSILKIIEKSDYDKEKIDIIYINFLKTNTIIWTISDFIYTDMPYIIKEMNESTFLSRTNKIDKKVYLLNPEDGIQIDYKLDKNYLIKKYESKLYD